MRSLARLVEDGNRLMGEGKAAEAVKVFRAAHEARPDLPGLAYNLGNALLASGKPAEAEPFYRAALALDPSFPGASNNLGNALRAQGRLDEAAEAYRAALALRPDAVGSLTNLAGTLLALRDPEAALAVLAGAPEDAQVANLRGGTLLSLDRPAEALVQFRRAGAMPQARFGSALAMLTLGDFRAGWRDYGARWEDPAFTEDTPDYPTPIWEGRGPVAGRRMLLHAEQGLGDTLQFIRYAPLVRRLGATVVLHVQAALVPLLAGLGDEIHPMSERSRDDPIPAHELRCPLLSLPAAFGTRLATIPAGVPYLAADAGRLAVWRERLGPAAGRRIGIAFAGSPEHPDDAIRSMPEGLLREALAPLGAELHVLQPGFGLEIRDFADTAALVCLMDAVVTVDTSLAHLAGALGRPVHVLLQRAADFRWLRGRNDSPWYPTMRLHRQRVRGEWDAALDSVRGAMMGFGPER